MFHRRPLDTIWHRLPIRHVSFKRRKQSMKDTRNIEWSPRFSPPPLWCLLFFFFNFVLPYVPLGAGTGPPGSCAPARLYLRRPGAGQGLPLPRYSHPCPGPGLAGRCRDSLSFLRTAPENQTAERCAARGALCPPLWLLAVRAPSVPAVFLFFSFFKNFLKIFLGKTVNENI